MNSESLFIINYSFSPQAFCPTACRRGRAPVGIFGAGTAQVLPHVPSGAVLLAVLGGRAFRISAERTCLIRNFPGIGRAGYGYVLVLRIVLAQFALRNQLIRVCRDSEQSTEHRGQSTEFKYFFHDDSPFLLSDYKSDYNELKKLIQ